MWGNDAVIYPTTFDTIIRNFKKRTMNIKDKLVDVKGITDLTDNEINEILKEEIAQTSLD